MDNDIFFFVNVLNDNHIVEKEDPEFAAKFSQLVKDADIDEEEVSFEYSENPFYVELNGYSDPNALDNYHKICFNQFKEVAVKSKLKKNKLLQDAISHRIISIREDLLKLKDNNKCKRYRNYLLLIEIKIKYCDKILGFLSNIKIETLKLSGRKIGDNSILTQKQVSILFYYLQKYGYVGKKMDKEDFTKLISEITDYSDEQFRKDFSYIEKISPEDNYGFQSVDFDLVMSSLKENDKNLRRLQEKIFT